MTIFGNIITRGEIEAACIQQLQVWIDTYLAEIERQQGYEPRYWPRPRSYTQINAFGKFPEDQLPMIIVVSPGMAAAPVRGGGGVYRTQWSVGIVAVVSAATQDATRLMADHYTAAIRALFTQRASVGQMASGSTWVDESYDDITDNKRRTLASGRCIFNLEVDNAVTSLAGPVTPDDPPEDPTQPIPDWPIVLTTGVEVDIVKELP